MDFSLAEIISARQSEQYALHQSYVNPKLARALGIIGFDKTWVKGEGAYLWDDSGTQYLDLLAGYSVYNLGRNHPAIKQAIHEILDLDRPNMVKMDCPLLAGLLAEALMKRMPAGLEAVFFANSGAEAIETAVKMARAATKRPRFLYLDHAFHGLTIGTLSLNGANDFRSGFEPLIPGFDAVTMDNLEILEKELRKGDVAGFVFEPIQGKGVYIPQDGYLPEAQRLCRKYGTLFICDEVQVGMGRSGRFLCSEYWGLEPDIVTLAKSLGGGYIPVSATIARRNIHEKMFNSLKRCQVHSTTFGQNDLAMAAGLATLNVMDEENLVERSAQMGEKLLNGLSGLMEKHDLIADVRGKGLMIGIEFAKPQSLKLKTAWATAESAEKGMFAQLVVMSLMRDHHILVQVGGPGVNIIKLLPPLIIEDQEVNQVISAFDAVLSEAKNLRGRVWSLSGDLIKHALAP
jgi:ornithine--oxo-acid transaminase